MTLVQDPMCGMVLELTQATLLTRYDGRTWYFCSIGCKQVFDANPAHHTHGNPVPTTLVRDPVCGMMVEPELAHHRAEFDGQVYAFCTHGCQTVFELNPQAYIVP